MKEQEMKVLKTIQTKLEEKLTKLSEDTQDAQT